MYIKSTTIIKSWGSNGDRNNSLYRSSVSTFLQFRKIASTTDQSNSWPGYARRPNMTMVPDGFFPILCLFVMEVVVINGWSIHAILQMALTFGLVGPEMTFGDHGLCSSLCEVLVVCACVWRAMFFNLSCHFSTNYCSALPTARTLF